MEATVNLLGAVKKKVKRKIWLWVLGGGIPLLIFLLILLVACIIPLLIFGGDSIYYSPGYDMYYGAESGGAAFKLTGSGTLFFPIDTQKILITSGFGMRTHPITHERKLHTGIDLSCVTGTQVFAADTGTVIFAGDGGAYGNLVIINHNNGFKTYYAHLSKIEASENSTIQRGQLLGYSGNTGLSTGPHLHFEVRKDDEPVDPGTMLGLVPDIPDVLPEELKYKEIDTEKLNSWLNSKSSLLADEPYFSTILSTAKEFDVSAVLMFAITGQEESFVKRTDGDAYMKANNPFNVFHSWYEYNTDIKDTSRIAARTIINLSKGRPATANPIAWINIRGGSGGYAEDPNWWIGVSKFFDQIKKVAS